MSALRDFCGGGENLYLAAAIVRFCRGFRAAERARTAFHGLLKYPGAFPRFAVGRRFSARRRVFMRAFFESAALRAFKSAEEVGGLFPEFLEAARDAPARPRGAKKKGGEFFAAP